MTYKKLGELLVEQGLITSLQLSIALAAQESSQKRLGEIVVERGFTTESAIADCLARQLGYPLADLGAIQPQANALSLIRADFALEHFVLPVTADATDFEVVLGDPVDIVATDEIAKLTRRRLNIRVAAPQAVLAKIREAYGLNDSSEDSGFDFNVPNRFGAIRPRRAIGAAKLFDAIDHELDRKVTLATLPTGDLAERTLRRRVQSVARTPHPNVVSVFDWFEHDGRGWAVFERLEGETLAHILRTRGPRPVAQAANWVAQISEGLEPLHVHGGYTHVICPGNVLIRAAGPQLLPLEEPGPSYGAPETELGATPTALADIFALGTLLWESIRGENPHVRSGTHAWSEVNPHEPGLPPAMVEILNGALQRGPERRTASALLLARSLRAFNWANLPTAMPAVEASASTEDRDSLLAALDDPTPTPKKGFWARLFGRAA